MPDTIRVPVELPALSNRQVMSLRNDCAFPELMPWEWRQLVRDGLIWIDGGAADLTPLGRAVLAHYEGGA